VVLTAIRDDFVRTSTRALFTGFRWKDLTTLTPADVSPEFQPNGRRSSETGSRNNG